MSIVSIQLNIRYSSKTFRALVSRRGIAMKSSGGGGT